VRVCYLGQLHSAAAFLQGFTKSKNQTTLVAKILKMKKNKYLLAGIIAAVAVSMFTLINSAYAQQPGTKRTELQRHNVSVSGYEAIQMRVDFDPGVSFPRHKHPGEEIIYVLEGLLEYQVEGRAPVTLKAGQVLFVPANTIHSAKNIGKGNGAELATYIVEKGKPLVELME
jgi:quercetin dioxygenase-like cupin family protein